MCIRDSATFVCCDFMQYPVPCNEEDKYDVILLHDVIAVSYTHLVETHLGTSNRLSTTGIQCSHFHTGVYILQIVPDTETARTDDKFLVSTRFKVLTLDLGDNRMDCLLYTSLLQSDIEEAQRLLQQTKSEISTEKLQAAKMEADVYKRQL